MWRDVVGYEGIYEISTTGSIRNATTLQIIKPYKDKYGYLQVGLYNEHKRKHWSIHRIVALAFIPNPESKPHVNHKDEDKTNNNVHNLEWVTAKENANHGTRNKRISISKKTSQFGSSNPNAKTVICNGIAYECIKECAEYYGVKKNTMASWLRGEYKMPSKFIDLGLRYADLEISKRLY